MNERPYVSFLEVKQRVSIPDVLQVLGIENQFAKIGDRLTGVCPLPNHKHGPKPNREQFKINRKDDVWVWHCFGDCQRGGDVVELVKSMTGYDNAHVRFWFAEHFGDRLSYRRPAIQRTASRKKEACESAGQEPSSQASIESTSTICVQPDAINPLRFFLRLDPTVPYLRERGLAEETIARFGIGLAQRGALAGYVAIPVYMPDQPADSNPVGYVGRWPGEDHDAAAGRPRYKVPQGFETSRVVYGLPQALTDTTHDTPLIILEGPFKVFALYQCGYPGVVSCFSSSVSDEQARILAHTGRPLVLLFDGDEAGYTGMRRAAAKLITQSFVRVIKLCAGTQPDDLSQNDLSQLLHFI